MIAIRRYITYTCLPVLLLGLTLAGCKLGKNYEPVEVESPESFRYTLLENDTVAMDILWWELFDDPILDTLVNLAMERNRNVQIAFRNVEQAGLSLRIQKAELLPKFNAQGTFTYGNNIAGIQSSGNNMTFLAASGLNWELDFWGKFRRLNEAAQADLMASQFGLRALQIELITSVVNTYFQLLEARTKLRISRQTLALRDSTRNLIQERYDKGIVAEIDLNQAEIQYAIALSAIPLYEREIAITEHSLSILVGVNPGPIIEGRTLEEEVIPPDLPVGMPAQLLTRRPDIIQAEQNIISQNAFIGVAQASRLPAISLTGLLGLGSLDLNTSPISATWNAGATLAGPIFHFGQNLRRVDIERSRTEQAYLAYEQTVLEALKEVDDALVSIRTLRDEVIAREEHVRAALNAQRLSEQRYDRGVTSYLEYLESQRQAFQAQIFLAEVRRRLLSAFINLYKSLGGGWLSEEEMVAAQEAIEAEEEGGE